MGRMSVVGLVVLAILGYGISLIDMGGVDATDEVAASLLLEFDAEDLAGYQSASGPRDWSFPADYGPHPGFGTEWWYYTGNLDSEDGRHFGYQFTLFRRSIAPATPVGDSEWRSDQVYMGHFTVSDVAGGRFHHDQRYSRDGAGLAGATSDPRLHIWLEDLDMQALNDEASQIRLRASMEGAAIDFTLEHTKPPRLRGIEGYSQKGVEAHQASYYYSIPRLATQGTLTLGGERIEVQGESWMDHEFFTQYLTADVVGWDWFALLFDDGRELSLGWLRLKDGGQRYYGGDGAAAFLSRWTAARVRLRRRTSRLRRPTPGPARTTAPAIPPAGAYSSAASSRWTSRCGRCCLIKSCTRATSSTGKARSRSRATSQAMATPSSRAITDRWAAISFRLAAPETRAYAPGPASNNPQRRRAARAGWR